MYLNAIYYAAFLKLFVDPLIYLKKPCKYWRLENLEGTSKLSYLSFYQLSILNVDFILYLFSEGK